MSDFDKEAERKKLEERFAEEEEEREATERMSELLLQGATMTDTHCNECGDPLFRYDGQTFCPTCQQTVSEDGTADASAGAADGTASTAGTAPTDGATPTDATPDEQRVTADESRRHSASGRESGHPVETEAQAPGTPNGEPQRPSTQDRRASPSQRTDSAEPSRAATAEGATNDLAAAEASLSRVLRRQAETAEQTDDLGRAREHLAAAREAATALEAVRTARR